MNVQAKITAASASPDYDHDGYGWAMAQARLMREGRFDLIDWTHIAEEIEGVAKSERRATESALRIVLLHILKWAHQETHRSRSWANSIEGHLEQFDSEMADNPSLKPHLETMLASAYRQARREAARETGLPLTKFAVEPPSWEEIRAPRVL